MYFLNTNPSVKENTYTNSIFNLIIISNFLTLGRIDNRFSNGIGIIDEMLPSIFIQVI